MSGAGGLARLRQAHDWGWLPVVLLLVVVALSLASRMYQINSPCNEPCRGPAAHGLIFDEVYYVNAARVIDGKPPPAGFRYAGAPGGYDPNAEHPQLGKLIIAANIRLFGDRPIGWRFGSIEFGTAALFGMFLLVTAASASRWLALGATSVMASDNLFLVHARIGTLDIYALTFMLFAAVLYLRRRPLLAGVVLGIGATAKEVVAYLVGVFLLLEAFERLAGWRTRRSSPRVETADPDRVPWWRRPWPGRTLLIMVLTSLAVYAGVLWTLDTQVPAYNVDTHAVYHNPLSHTGHILDFAAGQRSPNGPAGIASYPWQWLVNEKAINYFTVTVTTHANGTTTKSTPIAFKGEINPFIIFVAIPGLFVAAAAAWRRGERIDILTLAWFLGMYLPFLALSVIDQRTSYLYYMLIVMPAIYVATARLFSGRYFPRAATFGWAITLIIGFAYLYPIRIF